MMKFSLIFFIFIAAAANLFAVTVEIERLDLEKKYTALADTETVKYVDKCERAKFDPYEWKMWEGYYSARAFIQPIAVIKVRRGPNEFLRGNLDPFIKRAQGETAKLGANLFGYVKIKKNVQILEPDVMIFRAYKQLFQSGNAAWEAFFTDILAQGILLTLEDIQKGDKTKETLEKYSKPAPASDVK